jgi:hypothetical protein
MPYIADLTPCSDFGEGTGTMLAVGWVDHRHPPSRGIVKPAFVSRLVELLVNPWQPAQTLGWHDCTFCRLTRGPTSFEYGGAKVSIGTSNLFVPGRGCVYIAPSLILHFMDSHGYAPPAEFIKAVLGCPPMRSAEYHRALASVAPAWLNSAHSAPRRRRLTGSGR